MEEKRRAERHKGEANVIITGISGEKNLPKKIIPIVSSDISMSGLRIQTTSLLPVNTQLKIKVKLEEPPQMITAFAKVKWIERHPKIELYDAGLEFFDTSSETIQQLMDYVLWREKLEGSMRIKHT